MQVPAATIVTVAVPGVTVQMAGDKLAKTTGLPEAPPVADKVKVPLATKAIGVAGLNPVIVCTMPVLNMAMAWAAAANVALPA